MKIGGRRWDCSFALVLLLLLPGAPCFGLPCCDELPQGSHPIFDLEQTEDAESCIDATCLCCSPAHVGIPVAIDRLDMVPCGIEPQRLSLPNAAPGNPFHPPRTLL